jgi:lipid II:glycine glycyltransferase (peptidoglycan interpeptide bridge formation enzyme)
VNKYSPEIQQTNDVSALLDIWRARFSERGVKAPLLSDSYLKDLVAAFPQDMTVYSVSIDEKLAIANVYCAMQKERYAFWIGGVSTRNDLAVHEYIQWAVAQRAKSEGFKKLDLGGGVENLSRFKSKFDPVLEPYCIVERMDTLGKTVNFAWKKLSWAKKLASGAIPRGARR